MRFLPCFVLLWASSMTAPVKWQDTYAGLRKYGVVYIFSKLPRFGRQPHPIMDKCHGVIVGPKFVLTPCSCVTTTSSPEVKLRTPWYDPAEKEYLQVLPASTFLVCPLYKAPFLEVVDSSYVNVSEIHTHPRCTNVLLYDVAGVTLATELPHHKVEWIHTLMRDFFNVNLKRLEVASTVIPRCIILTSTGGNNTADTPPIVRKVSFQNWNMCLPKVCPVGDATNVTSEKEAAICFRKQRDTSWWCLEPLSDTALCSMPHGTPVFCDYNSEQSAITGLMGFLDNYGHLCPTDDYQVGVMIGLDIAVDYYVFADRIEPKGHRHYKLSDTEVVKDPY